MTLRSLPAVLVLVVTACAPGGESPVVPPSTTTTATTAPPASVPPPLEGFPLAQVEVAGEDWKVAVADTRERRARGLMGVDDLGGLDGMLFVFPEQVTSRFWMKDTLIPLDIAFFSEVGSLVEVLTMEPCTEDPCPTYGPERPYRWALEAPAGRLSHLRPGDRLVVPGA